MKKYNGLWIGKTGDANCWYHIYPFAQSRYIDILHVVRYKEALRPIPNVKYHLFKDQFLPLSMLFMFIAGIKVLRKNKIDFIVSFNPAPWGTVAWVLSRIYSKPLITGFIGKDFTILQQKNLYGSIIRKVAKTSTVITTTGSVMNVIFEEMGFDRNNIAIYPHCLPDSWFSMNTDPVQDYHLITVCELIKRKRIEDILQALHILKNQHPEIRFCIVGSGPEENFLKEKVNEFGLHDNVDFIGYTKQVREYLNRSKIYVQASKSEGLSISLVEAMAAGLVPVVTRAGSEEDVIEEGLNGFVIDVGNYEAMADKIEYLLISENYRRMQSEVLKRQHDFKIEKAIVVCDSIIGKILNIDQSNSYTNLK